MYNFLLYSFENVTRSNVQADYWDTDGADDNGDDSILEPNGTKYPHKSWYFIHNSTIKGKLSQPRHKETCHIFTTKH